LADDSAFSFPYRLTGGALRPDAISGLNANFRSALTNLYNAAPPEIQKYLGLTSAYRNNDVQRALWNASDKTGRTVAAPGHSMHNLGLAADLSGMGVKGNAGVPRNIIDWVHQNAGQYGLTFPMSYEPWHVQLAKNLIGSDGGTQMASNVPTPTPRPDTPVPTPRPDMVAPPDNTRNMLASAFGGLQSHPLLDPAPAMQGGGGGGGGDQGQGGIGNVIEQYLAMLKQQQGGAGYG
jgi:D-alanyl-D-alanine carboxypeptidase